jgi:uncharacterized protein (DUF58 family)
MVKQTKPKLRYLDPRVLQKTGSLSVVARQVVEGLRVGMHRSPLRGFSTEFAHHRPYVQGDEIRRLDWRIYGRTERYYVKLYQAETNFDGYLLLDASSSMRYGSGSVSKLEYAKFMAASLAYLIGEQHDSAGLAVFDSALRSYVPPSSAAGFIGRIEGELEKAQPVPRTNVAEILHEFARRIPRRGVVMLFSDLFDNVEGFIKGLNHLRFRKHNITVFHTLDPYELEFPFTGTCRFKGLENDGEIITQPVRVREIYLREVRKFVEEIRRACERIHVDYMLVDTARPLDEVLVGYLLGQKQKADVQMHV